MKIINSLHQILHTVVDFYYLYKHFHWNLEDSNFPTFHLLFDKHASLILASQDILAERIRQKGQKIDLGKNLENIAQNSILKEKIIKTKNNLPQILEFLIKEHQKIIELLEKTIEIAEKDPATADYLTKFLQEHQQMQWFLTSSLV